MRWTDGGVFHCGKWCFLEVPPLRFLGFWNDFLKFLGGWDKRVIQKKLVFLVISGGVT